MPRVSARCEYLEPLRYGDECEVCLTVREKTSKAICYDVVFRKRDGDAAKEVARGAMKVVYATRSHGSQEWTAAPFPPELAEQIEVAPASDQGTG
jgi:acyl-CoA thioesterase FadM